MDVSRYASALSREVAVLIEKTVADLVLMGVPLSDISLEQTPDETRVVMDGVPLVAHRVEFNGMSICVTSTRLLSLGL